MATKFLKNLDERKSDQDSYKEFIKEVSFNTALENVCFLFALNIKGGRKSC